MWSGYHTGFPITRIISVDDPNVLAKSAIEIFVQNGGAVISMVRNSDDRQVGFEAGNCRNKFLVSCTSNLARVDIHVVCIVNDRSEFDFACAHNF